MKYLILFFVFLCFRIYSHAQTVTWEKQFHFDQWTGPENFVTETADSGFLVTELVGNDTTALWLMKLNKYGNQEWRKMINSYTTDVESFVRIESGIYLLTDIESRYDSITKKESIVYSLIEFNESGDILWTKDYDSTNLFIPYGLFSLDGGNYIIEAALVSPGNYPMYYTPGKMLVQKFNGNHSLIWSDTLSYQMQTGSGAIIRTAQNKILVGGMASKGGINEFSFMLLLDSNGKKLNYVPYPYLSDSFEQVDFLGRLKNGNILMQTSGKDYYSVFFTLADSIGNTIKRWEKDGAYHNGTGGFVPDGDSIILLASEGLITGPLSLQKFDTSFHQLWEKNYDETSYYANYPQQILRTADGGLLLVGTRTASSYSDMVLIKVDDNGYCADEDLSGTSTPDNTTKEASVYPNPAIDNIYINTVNSGASLDIDIFDSKGVKVITLPQSSPGVHNINISRLSKGLYMYRLYNESGVYKEGKFVKE